MAGLYIHIPFCSKACHYCNFHFSTSLHRKAEMVQALQQELSCPMLPDDVAIERSIETVYFGGGTPSILTNNELYLLLNAIHKHFNLQPNTEITLEANPDDITQSKIVQWRALGINRLSIGVQSFDDADLRWMNRAHNVQQSNNSIQLAQDNGITNISIDLIYGLPGMENKKWLSNLEQAFDLQVPHLSCYALTVEEKTALDYFIRKGKTNAPSDALQSEQYMILMKAAGAAGFEQYEISNFAKPGSRSWHNSSYWQGKPYYGFGPSAHSFDGNKTRWWNVANNGIYLQQVLHHLPSFESEVLTEKQQLNEGIMTGLRTAEGLTWNPSQQSVCGITLQKEEWNVFSERINKAVADAMLTANELSITLTQKGKLFADGIAADLFL